MSKLEKFLKESTLSAEAKAVILEAWNEEKQDLVANVRDEMKQRFDADKASIVEGLNTMAQEVINEEMSKVYDEKRKLVEDRAVLRSNLGKFSEFSNGVLAKEIGQLRQDRIALGESLKKFAQFGNQVIAEELTEFHAEKQALVETRVKLMAEGKRKLHEAQQSWIKNTSAQAAKFVETQTRKEFTQLRTQLDEANRNMFGRKIFEAFATEFMSTQYNESKEIKKLSEAIKARESALQETKAQLAESSDELDKTQKRVRVMEDVYKRKELMSDLMKPLTQEQRVVMEGLLDKTPTARLDEDFKKYLKPVLNESTRRATKPAAKTQPLNESRTVTGNRKNTLLENEQQNDPEFMKELENMAKIAGIRK